MAEKNRADLLTQMGVIKNETTKRANTATRVGTAFEDVVDSAFVKDTDDSDDITEGVTNKFLTSANITSEGLFVKDTDDTDDITEGAVNKFLSIPTVELFPEIGEGAIPFGIALDDNAGSFIRVPLDDRYQPIAVSATVPANGALPEGKQVLVVNSTVGRELYVGDASNNPVPACGYRQYVALLTQSGTNAPVATVLKNTLGGTVVWTRETIGSYIGTLSGAFPINNTTPNGRVGFVIDTAAEDTDKLAFIQRITDGIIISTYEAGNQADTVLSGFPVDIRVYV